MTDTTVDHHDMWRDLAPDYVVEYPQMKHPDGRVRWRAEIDRLPARSEEVSRRTLDVDMLKTATREVTDKRCALRRLSATRVEAFLETP